MTNEIVNNKSEENVVVKKVVRRGIGSAKGTTRLKFTHELARPNGLFIAHLEDVTVSNIKIGEESTGMPSFNGMEIPKITFTFATNEDDVNKRHYQTLVFTAVESNVNTIPGGNESWKVDSVFNWIKHILNVYVLKGRELTEEEEEILSLNFTDFDEQGEYVSVEPEVVISAWRSLFENILAFLNNNGTPHYKNKDGKLIPVWIKLIRYTKNKSGWKAVNYGNLSFPTFVGEGCIEIFKQNVFPSIRLDSVKEAIIPMNIETPKKPNIGMTPNMGVNAGVTVGDIPAVDPMMSNNFNNIAQAAEDMPF